MTALILSGSYLESNRYLQSEGIRGRHAVSATSVRGDYFTSIVQLPSFANRPDRHAILSEIKQKTRGANKVDWLVLEEWSPPPKPEIGQEGYKADMLFGDVPDAPRDIDPVADDASRDMPPNGDIKDASANGDIPESDSTLTPTEEAELIEVIETSQPEDFVEVERPKPAAKKAAAKKPAKVVSSTIDDLFGDD